MNYVQHCGVECCDESVQCVFKQPVYSSGSLLQTQTGYVDEMGPSAQCTGGARRTAHVPWTLLLALSGLLTMGLVGSEAKTEETPSPVSRERNGGYTSLRNPLLVALLAFLAVGLQGCDLVVNFHTVGNWRKQPNYLQEWSVNGTLNTCMNHSLTPSQQCNGNGYCLIYDMAPRMTMKDGLYICKCEREWAGPDCSVPRKSQMKAFGLSLFLGYLGADYFYLGFPLWGTLKLFTLGGAGFWWLVDIVRTASGPVYAHDFRTAQDLTHWVAVLILLFVFITAGVLIAIEGYLIVRRKKRADVQKLESVEESRHWTATQEKLQGPKYREPRKDDTGQAPSFEGRQGFAGFGSTLAMPLPNAGEPYANYANLGEGPFGPAGVPGRGSPTPASVGVAPTQMFKAPEYRSDLLDTSNAPIPQSFPIQPQQEKYYEQFGGHRPTMKMVDGVAMEETVYL